MSQRAYQVDGPIYSHPPASCPTSQRATSRSCQLRLAFSISPSPDPIRLNSPCSFFTNAPASSAVLSRHSSLTLRTHLISGSVTISINPAPALFKSIKRSSPTNCDFAVSCSTCSCCMRTVKCRSTLFSPFEICKVPPLARGSAYVRKGGPE